MPKFELLDFRAVQTVLYDKRLRIKEDQMLNGWTTRTEMFAQILTFAMALSLAITFAPSTGVAQSGNRAQSQQQQQQRQQQQQQRQQPIGRQQSPRQVQLTPEQRAAQQKAAMESRAQQRAAQQAYATKQVIEPEGFPLTAEHTEYVNNLLGFWEQNSNAVEKYRCNFRRFQYDTEFVAWRDPTSNQLAAHSVAMGEIRFAAPDRARYETKRVLTFSKPPAKPGDEADYKEAEGDLALERWICDGKKTYEFDFENKRLYETELPPEMRGNVAESPLPFIFGGNRAAVLQRYWVRSATPKGVENEYWLELYPKRLIDSRNYSKIELVIAKEDFLPKAMHMFGPQYNPAKGNEKSQYFTFENREVNGQLVKVADFFRVFVSPRLPGLAWKRVVRRPGLGQAAAPPELRVPNGQPPADPASRR